MIERLGKLRKALGAQLRAGLSHGSDLVILAAVIKNEAGTANDDAKVAVAYAAMNRLGGVKHPSATVVSGDHKLEKLWPTLGSTARLSYLEAFVECLDAARWACASMEVYQDPLRPNWQPDAASLDSKESISALDADERGAAWANKVKSSIAARAA